MKRIFEILLPAKIDNTIRGSKIPFYVFALYAIVSLARSCIHLLSPDGGAGSIAGMDLAVAGADGIIFAFALWGSSQLLFAIMQLLVVFRYRSFVPFMYMMLMLEVLLRELVGKMKPVTFAHAPPGAIGNQLILPLAALLLGLALWSASREAERETQCWQILLKHGWHPVFVYDFYGLGGRDPRVRSRLQAYFRAYRLVIAALLAQGVARGEFRPLDVERLAILFAALYEGMLEMAMLDPDNVQAVSELVDALDVLFLGLRP